MTRYLIGLLLVFVSFARLYAGETTVSSVDVYDLDEIVVTASRRAESSFDLPASISSQDFVRLQEQRQVRTIPEAMGEISAVMVQKTGHGQGSPYIRGFTGLRTLFLVDGIRLNNSTYREGPNQYWNTVDPFSVRGIELVKGPSSVLYGSDAIGGTVNALSHVMNDANNASGLSHRLVLRGATAERSIIVRPEFAYAKDSIDAFGGISVKKFGDLTAGGDTGKQPMTGYDEYDADFKISVDLGDGHNVTGAIQHVNQDDAWRVHKTQFSKSWRGTTTGDERRRSLDQRRTLAYVQYRIDDLNSQHDNFVLSLSYHDQDESRVRVRNDGRTDIQGIEVGTIGLWSQLTRDSNTGIWTLGAEVYRDGVDSYRHDFNIDGDLQKSSIQGPVADDATYLITGVFLQNQVLIGEHTNVVMGARYTHSAANARNVEDPVTGDRITVKDSWSDLTGSIRASWSIVPTGESRVFAGVSQGFRAPNLSDMTRFDSARSNEIETPVIGLGAEKFVNYEIGLKSAGAKWDTQVSLYYTSIRDLITRTPTGRIIDGDNEITKRNSAKGYVKGIEVQARYHLSESIDVYGNLTLMDGMVDTFPTSGTTVVREPKDRLMPTTVWFGAKWTPVDSNYWAECLVGIAAKQDQLSTRDRADTDRIPFGGTPGFTVLTLRGGWQVSDELILSASLSNVLNEDYRIHGSGLNEAGRNLIVSMFWSP